MSKQQADVRQHEQEIVKGSENIFEDFYPKEEAAWMQDLSLFMMHGDFSGLCEYYKAATLAAEETFNQRLVELTSRIRELEADAKRYRFIRADGFYVVPDGQYIPSVHGEALDILIDAALTESNFTSSLERQYKENQG